MPVQLDSSIYEAQVKPLEYERTARHKDIPIIERGETVYDVTNFDQDPIYECATKQIERDIKNGTIRGSRTIALADNIRQTALGILNEFCWFDFYTRQGIPCTKPDLTVYEENNQTAPDTIIVVDGVAISQSIKLSGGVFTKDYNMVLQYSELKICKEINMNWEVEPVIPNTYQRQYNSRVNDIRSGRPMQMLLSDYLNDFFEGTETITLRWRVNKACCLPLWRNSFCDENMKVVDTRDLEKLYKYREEIKREINRLT